MAWVCYLLECADGTLYTGISNDLPRRLGQHARGVASKYTRSRLPVRLRWCQRHRDRGAALRREAAIKRLPRAEKLALAGRGAPRRLLHGQRWCRLRRMAKKKTAPKKAAKKPAAKKTAAKKASARKPAAKAASRKVAAYAPKPVAGIGWAPFRYPLPLI
jgi:putative endonuclease